MREPLLHSGVTDCLPEDHPLAFTSVNCRGCGCMVHAVNNECMTSWLETGRGPHCLECFTAVFGVAEDDTAWGLPGETP